MSSGNISGLEDKLAHLTESVNEIGKEQAVLRLSKQLPREEVAFLMDQLNGRVVAREKFPSLALRNDITYPPSYYLEQTSSERTARFKAGLVRGEVLIDMTGGFGIDTLFFSEKIAEVWYVEQDAVIYEIAAANLKALNPAIKTICGDSLEFLERFDRKADWLYLDPIRRTKEKRLTRVDEYSPNIVEKSELLFRHAENVMIKLSPMTDISQLVKLLENKVSNVYVLSVDNDCKELLVVSNGRVHDNPVVESINWVGGREEKFVSSLRRDAAQPVSLSEPMEYLYEPNAAVFKAQQYDEQAASHGLFKLHPNTHLFTSVAYHQDYQGRVYRIKGVTVFDSKSVKKISGSSSFNIKTRNFPVNVAAVAKKLGVKEGGEEFLFCVRAKDDKLRVLLCERMPAPGSPQRT
jgi:16S rRNA G966 N2-methylase RsmD